MLKFPNKTPNRLCLRNTQNELTITSKEHQNFKTIIIISQINSIYLPISPQYNRLNGNNSFFIAPLFEVYTPKP